MTTIPADLDVVMPYGSGGASARVRALDWVDHLGLRADVSDYLGTSTTGVGDLLRQPWRTARAEAALRRRSPGADRPLLLVRNASPLSNGAVESALLRRSARGVYDFDDALMVQQPGLSQRVFSRSRAWRRAVEAADQVIAGSDHLAEAAVAHNREVAVVPSCVEPDHYTLKADFEVGPAPVAVWVGSPSTEPYLAGIAPALVAAHRSTGLRLRVVSAGSASLGALDEITERVAWAPGVVERTLASADVGLMPLPDDPWTRGKCAYKLLQYAAAGLPVIGSPVGVNSSVLDTLGGLAATDDDQWRQALEAVVTMPVAERAALGGRAHAGVRAEFSFARWAGEWQRLVTGRPAPAA